MEMHASTQQVSYLRLNLHTNEIIIPEPTARSAVPGVSPGRGLLILFCISGVESRCS